MGVHLRHRPEAGGGIVELMKTGALNAADRGETRQFPDRAEFDGAGKQHPAQWQLSALAGLPRGISAHPAYPTGHGTVAGACITVLKFFFDGDAPFTYSVSPSSRRPVALALHWPPGPLTVNGELHKLAHNISFGHGIHAGIHWRSDTDYSILLGEAVAIDCLLDQIWTYQEDIDIPITKIDGTTQHFKNH